MRAKKTIFLVVILCGINLCMSACNNAPAEMPSDFNFTLDFGYGGKNCIDTYNSTFTKDLVADGTETIEFVIPTEKIQEIYKAFVEYKIFNLSKDISVKQPVMNPYCTYTLTYTYNKKVKTIVCDNADWVENDNLPDTHNRFIKLVKMIREYIYSTEEYQNMSPVNGGYQ